MNKFGMTSINFYNQKLLYYETAISAAIYVYYFKPVRSQRILYLN